MDSFERLQRDPFRGEIVEDHPNLALASDHADVAARGRREVIQRLFIVIVPACEDDGERRGRESWREVAKRCADIAD